MYMLLSPAKRQNTQVPLPDVALTQPHFKNETAVLIDYLRKFSPKALSDCMHISDRLADLNYDRFVHFNPNLYDASNSYPAAFLFQGDVYRQLAVDQWTVKDCVWAQSHLGILSGLYGCLKPLEFSLIA